MANQRGNLSPKALVAPLAAFTMAWVLFAYTRSSIQAAKVNARMKRSAAEDERSEGSRS